MTVSEQRSYWSRRVVSRRTLLRGAGVGLSAAGAALLIGCGDDSQKPLPEGELGPPEVTRIRLPAWSAGVNPCVSTLYVAEPFLRNEGFEPIYVPGAPTDDWEQLVSTRAVDFAQDFGAAAAKGIDHGFNLTVLAGVHIGCYEIFAHDGISSIGDLAGGKVAVPFGDDTEQPNYAFMVTIMNYIGVPANRVVTSYDPEKLPHLLQSHEIDAVLALQPSAENLRDLEGVRVIFDSATDQPFVNEYCCMLFANSRFVKENPLATLRALRALLKGAESIAEDPGRAASLLGNLDRSIVVDDAHRELQHLPYDLWRTFSPEESLRFYALRLKEAGETSMDPNKLVKTADWRFLDRLRQDAAYVPSGESGQRAFNFACHRTNATAASGQTGSALAASKGRPS